MQQAIFNKTFADLLDNAQPETIPTFSEGEFRGFRNGDLSTLRVTLDDPLISDAETRQLTASELNAVQRAMTTATSSTLVNFSKPNKSTWKYMILASGVLARAGVSFDTSGNFEGYPFFMGFGDAVATTWLGENASMPEHSPSTLKFPYEIHTVGAFTIASRRLNKLAPHFFPHLKIAQANAIKDAVEEAFIRGDSAVNANQPDGLVKQLTQQVLTGTSKSGLIILGEALEVLEGKGLDKSEVSVIMSPDVAKKLRTENASPAFPGLSLKPEQLLVSKFMPAGTMVTGRYADYQAVTSSSIEFLAHTYTPKGQPETGSTRVRSMFDVDAVVLNQDSFVKTTNIS